jgi:hypothetical protein
MQGVASSVTAVPGGAVPAKARRTVLIVAIVASALVVAAVLGGVAARTFLGDEAAIGASTSALTVEYEARKLQDHYRRILRAGAAKMLNALIDAHPAGLPAAT